MDLASLRPPQAGAGAPHRKPFFFTPETSVNVSYETVEAWRDRETGADRSPSKSPVNHTILEENVDHGEHESARDIMMAADAAAENFVKSLQEPKYAKALSGDEIAWLFQEFYRGLATKLEPASNHPDNLGMPMLSSSELATKKRQRRHQDRRIEHALDAVEQRLTVTLYPKLFEPSTDISDRERCRKIQGRFDVLRTHPDFAAKQLLLLDNPALCEALQPATNALQAVGLERSPQDKLNQIVQAHQHIASALEKTLGGAGASAGDHILPCFLHCMITSGMNNIWSQFQYIHRFRRKSAIVSQAEYCLTNLEASITIVESLVVDEFPGDVDPAVFAPIEAAPHPANRLRSRSRSSSQSSRSSRYNPSSTFSLGSLGATIQNYKGMLSKQLSQTPPPAVNTRFLHSDPEQLTISDVRQLLTEYKRLGKYVQSL